MVEFISANIAMLLCALAGLILLVIEAFLPGFGIAGIAGLIAEAVAVVLAWINLGPAAGLITLLVIGAVTAIFILLALRSVKKGRLNQYVLKDEEHPVQDHADLSSLVGKQAKVVSPLRPAGFIDAEGKKIEAISNSDFIPAGAEVRITKVSGNQVFVEAVKA